MNLKDFSYEFNKFTRRNKWLIVAIVLIGFSIYCARIFNYTIGIDSDIYMGNPNHILYEWNLAEGRFGLTLFQCIFARLGCLNGTFSNVLSVILLIASCILWCFFFFHYYEEPSKLSLLCFSLAFMSSTVWMEVIYFTYMAVPCMLGVFLSPIVIILMWEGCSQKKRSYMCCATLLAVVIVSVYQVMAALVFAGVIIAFLCKYKNEAEKRKETLFLLFKMLALLMVALVVYFILNYVIGKLLFKVEMSDYVFSKMGGNLLEKMNGIRYLIGRILIGNNEVNNSIEALKINEYNMWVGNILYLFATVSFVLRFFVDKRRRTGVFFLAMVSLFLSTIAVAIVGDGTAQDRYLHAVPLVAGFLIVDMTETIRVAKRWIFSTLYIICLIFLIRQCWSSALLWESDVRRYQYDMALVEDVDNDIKKVWAENVIEFKQNPQFETPIIILGKCDISNKANNIHTSIIGVSATMFCAEYTKIEATLRMVPFMNAQGYYYHAIDQDDRRIDTLREYAKGMPIYPNAGYVEVVDGVTVVKLSEMVY